MEGHHIVEERRTMEQELAEARARILDLERQLDEAEHVKRQLKRQLGLKDETLSELNFRLAQVRAACTRAGREVGDIFGAIDLVARGALDDKKGG